MALRFGCKLGDSGQNLSRINGGNNTEIVGRHKDSTTVHKWLPRCPCYQSNEQVLLFLLVYNFIVGLDKFSLSVECRLGTILAAGNSKESK